MDQLNQAIIDLLRSDGRMSNKQIAQTLLVSEPTVANRIKTMQNDKTIRIVAQRDAREDPDHEILCIVELYIISREEIEKAHEYLFNMDSVITAYETARRPEICAWMIAPSLSRLRELTSQIARDVPGITQLTILPILDVRRYQPHIGNLHHQSPAKPQNGDIQASLLALLEEDGRQTARSLAMKLSVAESTIHTHMKRLLATTSMKIALVCDASAMGINVWVDIRIKVMPEKLPYLREKFENHSSVTIVAELSGDYNLLVYVAVSSVEDLDSVVSEDIRSADGVVDFYLLRASKVTKHNFNYIVA